MRLQAVSEAIGIDITVDTDVEILRLNTLKDAAPDELSFFDNVRYMDDLPLTKAAAVILEAKYADRLPAGCVALCHDEPYLKMALASKLFAPKILDNHAPDPVMGEGTFIADTAYVANGAQIGKRCTIMPGAFVGTNAIIGDDVVLHPNVAIYRDCRIGDKCIIHANTVVGSDGFGFAHTRSGEHVKIYQNGNVVIEEDVEIGSNTSIDRAVFGSTLIKRGAKLDNLIQIGHNCVIGEYSIMVSQSGLAGSTILGRNVVMGGQAAAAGHLSIAPFTTFAARAGITKSITESGKTYAGFPLMEHRIWLKLQAKLAKLLK